jgi:hypothetical protein
MHTTQSILFGPSIGRWWLAADACSIAPQLARAVTIRSRSRRQCAPKRDSRNAQPSIRFVAKPPLKARRWLACRGWSNHQLRIRTRVRSKARRRRERLLAKTQEPAAGDGPALQPLVSGSTLSEETEPHHTNGKTRFHKVAAQIASAAPCHDGTRRERLGSHSFRVPVQSDHFSVHDPTQPGARLGHNKRGAPNCHNMLVRLCTARHRRSSLPSPGTKFAAAYADNVYTAY